MAAWLPPDCQALRAKELEYKQSQRAMTRKMLDGAGSAADDAPAAGTSDAGAVEAAAAEEERHETAARIEQLRAARAAGEDVPATWLPSLASFQSRLSWHCHFMQRLEDAPDMEDRELNPAYAGMNEGHQDERLLTAYAEGRTGYPMVDASMRCLRATGWLNFRMRAMLVSFGTHHLAQRWQDIGRVLAPPRRPRGSVKSGVVENTRAAVPAGSS